MKRNKKLIILIVVFFAVIAGAYTVKKLVPTEEELVGEVIISDISGSELTKLSWVFEGEECSFTKSEGVWKLEADAAFPVNTLMLDSIAEAVLGKLTSLPLYDASPADYGITETSDSVTVETKDTRVHMTFGNINDITDEYYMTVDGIDGIYMLDSWIKESFEHTKKNLLKREEVASMESAANINIVSGDAVYEYIKTADGWMLGDTSIDATAASNLISAIDSVVWQDTVSYNATDNELNAYGFNTPSLRLSVENEDGLVQNILFGAQTENGVYTKLEASKMVYLTDASVLNGIKSSLG